MKNDFDKKIKNLLEDATLPDTGFSLDKGAVWDIIEAKKTSKRIPFGKWISHAAAVIIGILICLPFLFHSKKETEQIVTVTKTVASPAQVIRDTVFIENKSNVAAVNKIRKAYQKPTQHPGETIATTSLQPTEVKQNIPEPTSIINNIQPKPALAATTKHKPGVLHFLDIENENSLPRTKAMDNYVLFKKISIPSLPNDNSETISMLIVKPSSR